jgi:hypothetical protein
MYARISAVCLALALMIPGFATAQVSTTGTIQVVISDAQGGRLPGVTVTARSADTVTTRTVASDAEGVATLESLAPSTRYTVTANLSGFRDITRENIRVSSGQITTLNETMAIGALTEAVTVLGEASPVVDVKRAVTGQDITLELTESLPTGRSYQSFLQLVPGVLADSPVQGGNPSSRSGMNWKDVITGDNIGVSTDNHYYFEGINVTDPVTGTFGANLNTEIIQEQHVFTGALPAEIVGSSGLVSTVITKSGSNLFTGSANYFFQNDALVAEDEHNPGNTFSINDTAFTAGGPIYRDHAWVFGSFRYLGRNDDVSSQDTHVFLRTVKTTNKQGFLKGSWAITPNDLVSAMFLNDPFERSGSIDPSVVASRDRARKQGGNNYSASYNKVWNNVLFDAGWNSHKSEITDLAIDRTNRNTIAFQRTDTRTLADEQLGGFGQDFPEFRPTQGGKLSVQWQTALNRVKGGFEFARHQDQRDLLYIPTSDPSQYTSISSAYAATGVTAASIANSTLWSTRQFNVNNASDFSLLIGAFNASAQRAAYYAAFDADGNGTITAAELGTRLVFNSTAGNPHGQVNYYRILQSATGLQDQDVRGYSFFGQDELTFDKFTFNVGLRGEQWKHYSTTGENIYSFDTTWSPRLSAVMDVLGDGRHKASAFWGRYYDPVRMDMTNFAGTTSGSTRLEQTFVLGQWITYRVRGFSPIPDGLFALDTKTPYTDELQLQYEVDLGRNMSGSVTYYNRRTRDIFEDFDPGIYTDPAAYPGPVDHPDSLFLGWDYMGFDPNNPPAANFYLGTLLGGERNYNGLEFVFRKRFSNSWQSLLSYNYLDATGNAVSDGNADFAGDVLWLDPRAPNMEGTVPGTVHHIFKAAGSYTTAFGVEFGGTYRVNSGSIVNKTQLASSRRLPIQVEDTFEFAGIDEHWVAPDAIGTVQNPGWGQVDVRVGYNKRFNRLSTEFFADVFNLFDDQAATRIEDLVAGTGATKFGDEIQWLQPRRAFLGVRLGF